MSSHTISAYSVISYDVVTVSHSVYWKLLSPDKIVFIDLHCHQVDAVDGELHKEYASIVYRKLFLIQHKNADFISADAMHEFQINNSQTFYDLYELLPRRLNNPH